MRMREIILYLLTIMTLRVLVTRKTEIIDKKIHVSVNCGIHEKIKFTNKVWLKNWIQRRLNGDVGVWADGVVIVT